MHSGPNDGIVLKRPNLFLVGAAKCGTTSLHHFLSKQPGVFMAQNKEPHFFSRPSLDPHEAALMKIVTERTRYEALFAGAGSAIIRGESSTSYLPSRDAAARISEYAPNAYVLIALRDPVDRAYSHYLYNYAEGIERRSFTECIYSGVSSPDRETWPRNYISGGLYVEQMRRYLLLFPGRVLVLFLEEVVADPRSSAREVLSFLGLGAETETALPLRNGHRRPTTIGRLLLPQTRPRLVARSIVPRRLRPALRSVLLRPAPKPALSRVERAALQDAYAGEDGRLEEILGRRVHWDRDCGKGR